MLAILISLIIFLFYFFFIYKFSRNWIDLYITSSLVNKIIVPLSIIIPGLAVFLLLNNEEFIYYWDYSGYWVKSINFVNSFNDNPFKALDRVYSSIKHDEYNFLPNLFLVFAIKILGLNFNSYVLAVYLVYAIPASVLFSEFFLLTNKENLKDKNLFLYLPSITLLFTPLIIPIRFGFVGIIGLVPLFMILILFVKNNYLTKKSIKNSIYIGLLVLCLVFTRRWYAFWAVSFFMAAFLSNLGCSILKRDYKIIISCIINLAIASCVSLAIMLVFFYDFFEMSVLKDYGDIYSSYRQADFFGQINNFIRFFGYSILLITLLGGILMLFKDRFLFLFLLLSTLVIIFTFTRVNDFGGYQHFYILMPFILILFYKAYIYLFKKFNYWSPLIFCGILLISNVKVFFPNNIKNDLKILSSIDAKQHHRNDYKVIMDMAKDVDSITNAGHGLYVLASSKILNDGIVKNTQLPEQTNPFQNLKKTQHIDKRDLFPNELFVSNYIIITSPTQVHLPLENQLLISYFNKEINNGILKRNYKKVKTYTLQNNVTAFLMKKINGLNDEQINEMEGFFKSRFKEYPYMYKANKYALESINTINGDNYGNVSFNVEEEGKIVFFPGIKRETKTSIVLDSTALYNISFKAGFYNKDKIEENCNEGGHVHFTLKANDSIIESKPIAHQKDVYFNFEALNASSLTFEVSKGKYEDYCDWFHITDLKIEKSKNTE